MAKLGDFTTIIKTIIDDTNASLDQTVIDAFNYLGNIFTISASDISQSTVIGNSTLNLPALCNCVQKVFIGGVEILKLKDLDNLPDVLELGQQRWYVVNQKITFTQNFTSVAAAVIYYEKSFVIPTVEVDTDMPDRFFPMVHTQAVANYYDRLCIMVITNRQKYPDVEPEEIKQLSKDFHKQAQDLINSIQMHGYPL